MNFFKALAATVVTSVALYAQSVSVNDAYVREVPPNMPNSAAFMTLMNGSDQNIALVSAASDVANTVELHEHVNVNGMMQMRQIPKIEIPAHGSTFLKPGGLHVMLIGLTRKLKEGETVAVTLNFSNGEQVSLEAPVKKVAAGMMMKKHGAAPADKSSSMKCGSGKCGK
jgi:copper(I)-binding protein